MRHLRESEGSRLCCLSIGGLQELGKVRNSSQAFPFSKDIHELSLNSAEAPLELRPKYVVYNTPRNVGQGEKRIVAQLLVIQTHRQRRNLVFTREQHQISAGNLFHLKGS